MKLPKEFVNSGSKLPEIAAVPVPPTPPADGMMAQAVTPPPPVPASQEEMSKIDISWLPFAAKTYNISPNLDDYVIVNQMICPSDLPNRNGVGFQTAELVRFLPPPMNRQVFKAWTGCPVHLEHANEIHTDAIGVIFDTSFRRIQNYGDGQNWAVYGLVGIDKTKFPELAEKVRTGQLNTGSMGCLADSFSCSICGSKVHDNKFMNCGHITSSKEVNWKYVDHEGQKKVAFLFAHGLSPIEYSVVADPAWATCLSDNLLEATDEPTAIEAAKSSVRVGSETKIVGFKPPPNGDTSFTHRGKTYCFTGKVGKTIKTDEETYEYEHEESASHVWVSKSGIVTAE